MDFEQSIARLESFARRIAELVTGESTEAELKAAENKAALEQAKKTIDELKSQVTTLQQELVAAGQNPDMAAKLEVAVNSVETAIDTIGDIIKETNLTPISDAVVTSVQTDSADTPSTVAAVTVSDAKPTPSAAATEAATAISDAVETVTSEPA